MIEVDIEEESIVKKVFYVLVPVYNVERYIQECIQSVLDQTYSEFRLVLVDDGSSDHSGIICDTYAAKDSRIHVIHQENRGQVIARQVAAKYVLQQADLNNAFVVYLDSDDLLRPKALETILNVFETEICDMVVYRMDKMYDKKIVQYDENKSYFGKVTDKRELYKIVFMDNFYNSLCCKAITAKFLTGTNFGNVSYVRHGGDLLESISYYQQCQYVVFIKDILYTYRMSENSITRGMRYENFKVDSTAQRMVWKFLQEQDVWNEQDYKEYFYHLRKLMRGEVRIIAQFETNIENKSCLFDDMKFDEYYSMVLSGVTYKDHWLSLLKHGRYRALCREVQIRDKLRVLYHKVRKGR